MLVVDGHNPGTVENRPVVSAHEQRGAPVAQGTEQRTSNARGRSWLRLALVGWRWFALVTDPPALGSGWLQLVLVGSPRAQSWAQCASPSRVTEL